MDTYPCKLINFLFYEKCVRPSYKMMQFTFQKTCYWSNKDNIFDVLHQSCMAPWTRQLIPADIWSQTLYSCDPRSRRGGSRGRVQGVRTPPPWAESFFIFAFKICLPHRSVTSFLRGAPLLRKILDPPLSRFLWVLDLGNWTGSFRPI